MEQEGPRFIGRGCQIYISNDQRTIKTETFELTIPSMPNQHYWADGTLWESDYPGSQHLVILCSPCCDPLACLSTSASQDEADLFLQQHL
jgi:hypothetical protein